MKTNRSLHLIFQRRRLRLIGPALIASWLAVAESPQLSAATVRLWTGASATSGNWTTAANWQNNQAPVAGDTLSFTSTGLRKTSNTNNYPPGTAFSTINLFGTGYRLRGNSVTISNFVGSGAPTGTNTVDLDLTATGPGAGITLRSVAATDRVILNGDIHLNGRPLTTDGPGDFVIGGVISGAGGIRKNNSGDLSLSGVGANTFTGSTIVSAGTLRLGRYTLLAIVGPRGVVAIPDDLVIGSGTGGSISDVVVLERDNQIANTSHVAINGSGSLDLSDENDAIGPLTLTGGTVVTGSGLLTLGGPVRVNSAAKNSVISGRLNLGQGTARLFDVLQNAALQITAEISGSAAISLVKSNRGELFLMSSNTFAGDVEMRGGTLIASDGWALGDAARATRLFLGTLVIDGTIGVVDPLDVQGPVASLGLIGAGSASWIGPVTLNDDLVINVPTNRFLTITGRISGPAGWRKTGDGTLQFKTTFTNNYSGVSWVEQGDMILDGVFHQPVIPGPFIIGNSNGPPGAERVAYIKQHQIGDAAPVTIHKSGVLALQTLNDTIGSLAGSGAVDLSSGSLAIGGNGQSTTFSGVISGAGGRLDKIGPGLLTLTSNHTFTGETRVMAGSLLVNGSLAPSSLVVVSNRATLGGNGLLPDVTVLSGGILGPGIGPGRLSATGSVTFASSSLYCIDLNGTTAGVLYDQLELSGPLQLGGARLEISLAFTPVIDDSFTIIRNTGGAPVQGTFAGLPQGSQFSLDGMAFFIDYQGGEGNDVVLTRLASANFTSIMATGLNQMKLRAQGAGGLKYVIEATPHLHPPILWTPISTNMADGAGFIEFTDINAHQFSMRFYRLRSL